MSRFGGFLLLSGLTALLTFIRAKTGGPALSTLIAPTSIGVFLENHRLHAPGSLGARRLAVFRRYMAATRASSAGAAAARR